MSTPNNMTKYLILGVKHSALLENPDDQYECLKNYISASKYLMAIPCIRRVKSVEFKYEPEKYQKEYQHKIKKTKSFPTKIFNSSDNLKL